MVQAFSVYVDPLFVCTATAFTILFTGQYNVMNPEGGFIVDVALLAGIGFTISLFINGLAFKNPLFIDQAKYDILIASIVAGILGTIV